VRPLGAESRNRDQPKRKFRPWDLRRAGSLWEITAVPEIVSQCDAAALSIAALEHFESRELELSGQCPGNSSSLAGGHYG